MDREQFRARLKQSIEGSGMTQAEIARRVGVKPSTVSQYLSGKSVPSLITFFKLKLLLGFRADYLLGHCDEP